MTVARHFGSGVMIGTPTTGTAPYTPVEFGVMQEVSVDFTFTSKPLVGQYQLPVAMGRGVAKITGKAKFAEMNGDVFNTLFFANITPTTGQDLWSYNEGQTIPASTPWHVTVTNSSTWATDLGVKYAATGNPFTKVTTITAAGQYTVAAGVYTFGTADASAAVLISYGYTSTASGQKAVIGNPLLGVTPTFQIDFYQLNPNVSGAQWSFRLFQCISTKLSIGSKLEDWTIPEFDFEAFTNAANQLGNWNTEV